MFCKAMSSNNTKIRKSHTWRTCFKNHRRRRFDLSRSTGVSILHCPQIAPSQGLWFPHHKQPLGQSSIFLRGEDFEDKPPKHQLVRYSLPERGESYTETHRDSTRPQQIIEQETKREPTISAMHLPLAQDKVIRERYVLCHRVNDPLRVFGMGKWYS